MSAKEAFWLGMLVMALFMAAYLAIREASRKG
jgi:hypothetical protein